MHGIPRKRKSRGADATKRLTRSLRDYLKYWIASIDLLERNIVIKLSVVSFQELFWVPDFSPSTWSSGRTEISKFASCWQKVPPTPIRGTRRVAHSTFLLLRTKPNDYSRSQNPVRSPAYNAKRNNSQVYTDCECERRATALFAHQ